MVKLTVDLIQGAAQYINPVKDRELDLRGYKIPIIENLGATLNQFDCIDFTDNEIRKIDNFPVLPRIKTLYFNNNRIVRIGEGLEQSLPQLQTLIMTNNNVQELSDLEPLSSVKNMNMLSFLHNPVCAKPNYRLYVIYKFPNLKVLDFKKVKQQERDQADALFTSKRGKDQMREIKKKARTFVPGAPLDEKANGKAGGANPAGLNPEQIKTIKAAIARASTLEEIERLNHMLRTGQVPTSGAGNDATAAAAGAAGSQPYDPMVEEDE